ncbi:armadillo-like helical domain containing protein 1 [Cheilinus undulatus]|uniref:armadillo-like helical domain containing protein 1 n=1 Tax=Cheilinus undulatus TaxID=241271 RepID=UPI001BD2BA07|nr:armadillo-like helical domain containing protein 1 [Cheilinus undulatus]
MSATEQQANIGKVLSFLRDWDRGDRTVRGRMLNSFVSQNTRKTYYELELEFAQIASLFLARVTTWMRLTYMFGTFLDLQLKAIGIFLSASSHDQFIMEFLEDGGVLTLLEILGHSKRKEEEKAEALHLLLTVSKSGRKYKEFICESNGVKAIAEVLAISNTDETKETAQALLESLSNGNPKYQNQIYKSLIALMTCSSPKAQQLVLYTLHPLQSKMRTASHSIVEPLLKKLMSLHLEVQNGAINLILLLKSYDVRPVLLSGLVALLRPTKEEVQEHQNTGEAEIIKTAGSLPVFVQQAAAAKTIRLLAEDSPEVSCELLSLGVVQHLLFALGNREYTDAQLQASLALKHFVHSDPAIEEQVKRIIGRTLFTAFMHKAETLYMNIDETQAEFLLNNSLNVTEDKGLDGGKSEG